MNRERAETYLRLLGEAELREPMTPRPALPWYGGYPAGTRGPTLQVVAQALTAVDALDPGTAEAILADFELAASARQQRPGQQRPGQQPGWQAGGISGPAIQAVAARMQFMGPSPAALLPSAGPAPGPRRLQATAGARAVTAAGPPPPGPQWSGGDEPERFVPVGLMIPLRDEVVRGGLYLMSYARTAAGAWFTVAWRAHDPAYPGLPDFGLCPATDDRGRRYHLDFTDTSRGPEWTGAIRLRPDPPASLRWLDICPPDGTAVRVDLAPLVPKEPADPDGAATVTSETRLSPGEHLLTLAAERLLTMGHDSPRDLRHQLAVAVSPEPLSTLATGLGEVTAALEAADILPPLSPFPGRLAALCASLGINAPGLTAPPAHDLPERWLSLLAHYHRRKPDSGPARDGYAALAAALPDLDGIRLALLGLSNSEGHTWLHALASGLPREVRHGPFGIDLCFPLSVWIRDSGGRWHLARTAGRHRAASEDEDTLTLQFTPPLTRSADWIEVLAAGRSAQVRARLPLRWGCPL